MAVVTRLRKAIRRLASNALRDNLGGTFIHRGIRFRHHGMLIDQEKAAAVVDATFDMIMLRGPEPETVDALLARTIVTFLPPARSVRVGIEVHAAWSGGLWDRGLITLHKSPQWSDRLGSALFALLLRDLEPDKNPVEAAAEIVPRPPETVDA